MPIHRKKAFAGKIPLVKAFFTLLQHACPQPLYRNHKNMVLQEEKKRDLLY